METDVRKKRAKIVLKTLKSLFPEVKPALHYTSDYEFLIAVILSAQCTDKKVNEVTEKLFNKYPKLEDYNNANFDEFCQDIRQTGFYRNKAKNVLATTVKLSNDFGGKVPKTMNDLLSLPGVARKTANVVLGELFRISEGIAVDTHVIRLSHKFKLTDAREQSKIERELMEILPKSDWREITLRMGNYGRQYSPAHKKNQVDDPVTQKLMQEGLL